MNIKKIIFFTLVAVAGSLPAWANPALLSDDDLSERFAKAREQFMKNQQTQMAPPPAPKLEVVEEYNLSDQPKVAPEPGISPALKEGSGLNDQKFSMRHQDADVVITSTGSQLPSGFQQDVQLSDIRIAVNLENVTLRRAVDQIVKGAENKAGPWQVKWRLQPANSYLLDQRVNLTAESNFGSFLNHVLERVNNMTGVQLFVAVFEASRIIVISDTYY